MTPALWIGLAVLAIVRLSSVIWLSLVGESSYADIDIDCCTAKVES